jgi:seryl-tRNA synthetase
MRPERPLAFSMATNLDMEVWMPLVEMARHNTKIGKIS